MRKRLSVLLLPAFVCNCINYSSYQDARIVERGHSQGTVAMSVSKYTPHGDSNPATADQSDENWFVIQMDPRWGIGGRFDTALHMSVLVPDNSDGEPWLVLGADARMAVIRKYLAVTLPLSMGVGEFAVTSANLQPGVIVTLPVADQIDINASVRRSFFLSDDYGAGDFWLYNVGLGLEVVPGWRIRPELGWMISKPYPDHPQYGDDGQYRSRTVYSQFGIGVSRSQ